MTSLRKTVMLAVVGLSALCVSAVGPRNMAPAFSAEVFAAACPGTKDGDCRPNHHCPIEWTCYESSGPLNGKGKGTPLYCTDGGGEFVGCGHVFHSITRCAVALPPVPVQ